MDVPCNQPKPSSNILKKRNETEMRLVTTPTILRFTIAQQSESHTLQLEPRYSVTKVRTVN